MSATDYIPVMDVSYDDWAKLDRETQIHMAPYDDGEFRILAKFECREMRLDGGFWKPARVIWESCEELIDGRWEGFVSAVNVEWL